jgi:MFS family permease
MILLVRESPVAASAKAKLDLNVRGLPGGYWKYLFATALFGVGNSSNSFLILRTNDLGASLTVTILIYALFNLVAALASYPAGYLSDKVGRKSVLLFALLIFLAVYSGFGLTRDLSSSASSSCSTASTRASSARSARRWRPILFRRSGGRAGSGGT